VTLNVRTVTCGSGKHDTVQEVGRVKSLATGKVALSTNVTKSTT